MLHETLTTLDHACYRDQRALERKAHFQTLWCGRLALALGLDQPVSVYAHSEILSEYDEKRRVAWQQASPQERKQECLDRVCADLENHPLSDMVCGEKWTPNLETDFTKIAAEYGFRQVIEYEHGRSYTLRGYSKGLYVYTDSDYVCGLSVSSDMKGRIKKFKSSKCCVM